MEWSPQQDEALQAVSRWLKDKDGPQVFRLFGWAGTGKSTLARHLAGNGTQWRDPQSAAWRRLGRSGARDQRRRQCAGSGIHDADGNRSGARRPVARAGRCPAAAAAGPAPGDHPARAGSPPSGHDPAGSACAGAAGRPAEAQQAIGRAQRGSASNPGPQEPGFFVRGNRQSVRAGQPPPLPRRGASRRSAPRRPDSAGAHRPVPVPAGRH